MKNVRQLHLTKSHMSEKTTYRLKKLTKQRIMMIMLQDREMEEKIVDKRLDLKQINIIDHRLDVFDWSAQDRNSKALKDYYVS